MGTEFSLYLEVGTQVVEFLLVQKIMHVLDYFF